jgi:beta-lactamase regulating signal transducer with metallopeptidase domain
METLPQILTSYLLTQSWQIAVVFILVAIACWLLRNASAHWRYLLWCVVLAKCLAPPLLQIPLAVLPPDSPPPPQAVYLPSEPVASSVMSAEPAIPTNPPDVAISHEPLRRVVLDTQWTFSLTWQQWTALAWLGGTCLFVAIVLIRTWRTHRFLKNNRKAPGGPLKDEITAFRKNHSPKQFPQLWEIEGFGQPFVWGFWRGDIYLPTGFENQGARQQRQGILMHELAHVLRKDAAFNALQLLVQAIFFFHPLIWWTNRKIRQEREKCCDEMAIANLNADPKQYGAAIVDSLMQEFEQRRTVPTLAIAGPIKNIEDRLKLIMQPNRRFFSKPTRKTLMSIFLLALITVPTTWILTARGDSVPNAADLVRAARESEDWVHHVKSLYLRLERNTTQTPDGIAFSRQELHEMTPKPGMQALPDLRPTRATETIEYAIEENRLRFSKDAPDFRRQVKLWDGKQAMAHGEYYDNSKETYVLKSTPRQMFHFELADLNWLRSGPHSFWWHPAELDGYRSLYGRPEDHALINEETFMGEECYVLEYLMFPDAARNKLKRQLFIGKTDRLLYGIKRFRNERLSVEHWTLDYREVAPSCWLPMKQGHQFYHWDQEKKISVVRSRHELNVVEVRVNESLPDQWFQMDFKEGVEVQDHRFGKLLKYPYRANRPEAEWGKIRRTVTHKEQLLGEVVEGYLHAVMQNNDDGIPQYIQPESIAKDHAIVVGDYMLGRDVKLELILMAEKEGLVFASVVPEKGHSQDQMLFYLRKHGPKWIITHIEKATLLEARDKQNAFIQLHHLGHLYGIPWLIPAIKAENENIGDNEVSSEPRIESVIEHRETLYYEMKVFETNNNKFKMPYGPVGERGLFTFLGNGDLARQLMEMNKDQKGVKVLAKPRIPAFDGQTASVEIGKQVPYGIEEDLQQTFVGTKITLKGTLSEDRKSIELDLQFDQTSLAEPEQAGTTAGRDRPPALGTHSLNTHIVTLIDEPMLLGGYGSDQIARHIILIAKRGEPVKEDERASMDDDHASTDLMITTQSPQDVLESYIIAVRNDNNETAARYLVPEAPADAWFTDFRELMSGRKYFTDFNLLVEPPRALAFRMTSVANREYLIVSLEKQKEQWLIRDIDLDTEKELQKRQRKFGRDAKRASIWGGQITYKPRFLHFESKEAIDELTMLVPQVFPTQLIPRGQSPPHSMVWIDPGQLQRILEIAGRSRTARQTETPKFSRIDGDTDTFKFSLTGGASFWLKNAGPMITINDGQALDLDSTTEKNYTAGYAREFDDEGDAVPIRKQISQGFEMTLTGKIDKEKDAILLDLDFSLYDVKAFQTVKDRAHRLQIPSQEISSIRLEDFYLPADKLLLLVADEDWQSSSPDNREIKSMDILLLDIDIHRPVPQ